MTATFAHSSKPAVWQYHWIVQIHALHLSFCLIYRFSKQPMDCLHTYALSSAIHSLCNTYIYIYIYIYIYSEACLSDHLYAATTSLHRPQRKVPNDSYRKAPRTNSSTATTCLMWTTTAHADNQRTKFSCQLQPVGVTIRRVVAIFTKF